MTRYGTRFILCPEVHLALQLAQKTYQSLLEAHYSPATMEESACWGQPSGKNAFVNFPYFDDAGEWHEGRFIPLKYATYHANKLKGKIDSYWSIGTLKTPKNRTTNNVDKFHTIYVDLDFSTDDDSRKYVEKILAHFKESKQYPLPSQIDFSGRGAWMKWHVPGYENHKWFRSQIELLHNILEPIVPEGVIDRKCKDIVRVCRVPGTVNSKSGKAVTCYTSKKTYKVSDFPSSFFKKTTIVRGKACTKKTEVIPATVSGSTTSYWEVWGSNLLENLNQIEVSNPKTYRKKAYQETRHQKDQVMAARGYKGKLTTFKAYESMLKWLLEKWTKENTIVGKRELVLYALRNHFHTYQYYDLEASWDYAWNLFTTICGDTGSSLDEQAKWKKASASYTKPRTTHGMIHMGRLISYDGLLTLLGATDQEKEEVTQLLYNQKKDRHKERSSKARKPKKLQLVDLVCQTIKDGKASTVCAIARVLDKSKGSISKVYAKAQSLLASHGVVQKNVPSVLEEDTNEAIYSVPMYVPYSVPLISTPNNVPCELPQSITTLITYPPTNAKTLPTFLHTDKNLPFTTVWELDSAGKSIDEYTNEELGIPDYDTEIVPIKKVYRINTSPKRYTPLHTNNPTHHTTHITKGPTKGTEAVKNRDRNDKEKSNRVIHLPGQWRGP